MDTFQKQLLDKIEQRSSGSLRNDVTILDSHQESVTTPFTSIISPLKYHPKNIITF